MRNHRHATHSSVTRGRIAAVGVAIVAVVAASLFVVHARSDLHTARAGLATSQHHVAQLDAAQRDAVDARTRAFAALEREQDVLRTDSAARNRLEATDRTEYHLLTQALQNLAQHQSQLTASATHAALLDECLTGASQVLNEAAVGDVAHLATTLPTVQQLCTKAAS